MYESINYLPEGLLDVTTQNIHEILSKPTLIHLFGKRKEPLFVSVLLHGNEDSGFLAIQNILKYYNNKELPRALSVFIGNVQSSKENRRHLEHQEDFNRCWLEGNTPERIMAQSIIKEMRSKNPFASLDIHNTSGINPHYACLTKLDQRYFHLATLFSRTVIYYKQPEGTQTSAFSEICPSVTVECGRPSQPYSVEHAYNFIDACLHLSHFPEHPVPAHDMELYHTMATIRIPDEVSFSFHSDETDIRLRKDLDHLNFQVLSEATMIGYTQKNHPGLLLEAKDEQGNDVSEKYFRNNNGVLELNQEVMPSLLSVNEEIIRLDCLGYFMERYNH